jgi:hypothetical protein
MPSSHSIRQQLVFFELAFICRTAFFKRIPVLRRLHRGVTADITVIEAQHDGAEIRIDFRSPYFGLPVSVDAAQIGAIDPRQRLQPAAFRFFDWQTWSHIDGTVDWRGERSVQVKGDDVDFITGFEYRIPKLRRLAGNLGLRLAEGIEATVRIACGMKVARVPFEPAYWLLEATADGFRPVPIQSNKLMGLIVALFDLGSDEPAVSANAVDRLQQWAELNLDSKKPFRRVSLLLRYIRDWGPLGRKPMFAGVVLVLQRLQVQEPARHLFDFFADNWGVRNNPSGRLLAVRLLEALADERSQRALLAILELVNNQDIAPRELDRLHAAIDNCTAAMPPAKGCGGGRSA